MSGDTNSDFGGGREQSTAGKHPGQRVNLSVSVRVIFVSRLERPAKASPGNHRRKDVAA